MGLSLWTRLLISYTLRSVLGTKVKLLWEFPVLSADRILVAHKRQMSLMTGAQLATRGRRDMSSRVRDVVLSLALCHNVSVTLVRAGSGVDCRPAGHTGIK